MVGAVFLDVERWVDSFPRIEVCTAYGIFDLRNYAEIEAINIAPQMASMTLVFLCYPDGRTADTEEFTVMLKFSGIRDLRISQAEDFDVRACAFKGIVHDIEGIRSRFVIDLGDMDCEFHAESFQVYKADGVIPVTFQ
ncbi:hypothetical protein ACIBI9_67650 [Nonomuraea sp. NPDC050451]|uniref:hypothetical protein n=1 Tax=Nonomuraea sp. NPDC050451 TaxID=3364364 RepID=UPI0037A5886E